MHGGYPLRVADLMAQTRDLLVEIASRRKKFRHKQSGYINESALARALGVRSTTVHRILHLKREPAIAAWYPSPQLLQGLADLGGYTDDAEALAAIREARPQPDTLMRELIRPAKRRRSRS